MIVAICPDGCVPIGVETCRGPLFQLLGLALNTFGHFIEDIERLMSDAELFTNGSALFLLRLEGSVRYPNLIEYFLT